MQLQSFLFKGKIEIEISSCYQASNPGCTKFRQWERENRGLMPKYLTVTGAEPYRSLCLCWNGIFRTLRLHVRRYCVGYEPCDTANGVQHKGKMMRNRWFLKKMFSGQIQKPPVSQDGRKRYKKSPVDWLPLSLGWGWIGTWKLASLLSR